MFLPSKLVISNIVEPGYVKCLIRNLNRSLLFPLMKLALESLDEKLVCSSSTTFVGEKNPRTIPRTHGLSTAEPPSTLT